MAKGKHWTDAQLAEIHALFEAGKPLAEIARIVGRTQCAVECVRCDWRKANGLARPAYLKSDRARDAAPIDGDDDETIYDCSGAFYQDLRTVHPQGHV